MGRGLSKTELSGLIFLGFAVITITTCAFLLKTCKTGAEVQDAPEIIMLQDNGDSAPSAGKTGVSERNRAAERVSSKKNKKKRKSKSKKRNADVASRDPFSDTIEVER